MSNPPPPPQQQQPSQLFPIRQARGERIEDFVARFSAATRGIDLDVAMLRLLFIDAVESEYLKAKLRACAGKSLQELTAEAIARQRDPDPFSAVQRAGFTNVRAWRCGPLFGSRDILPALRMFIYDEITRLESVRPDRSTESHMQRPAVSTDAGSAMAMRLCSQATWQPTIV
jgi:hypothetical protein